MTARKVALLALLSSAMAAGSAVAQTCASPTDFMVPGTGAIANGDTCTAANELGTLCGLLPSPQNDIVFGFNINTPYTATTVTLTNNTPGFDAAMLLLVGACGPNQTCERDGDLGGAGANETMNVAGLANGQHYLVVTGTPTGSAAGCGGFQIAANGTWPVELQHFTVD